MHTYSLFSNSRFSTKSGRIYCMYPLLKKGEIKHEIQWFILKAHSAILSTAQILFSNWNSLAVTAEKHRYKSYFSRITVSIVLCMKSRTENLLIHHRKGILANTDQSLKVSTQLKEYH